MRRRVKKEQMKTPDDIDNDERSVSPAGHDTAWCDTCEWLRVDDHEWFEDAKTQVADHWARIKYPMMSLSIHWSLE